MSLSDDMSLTDMLAKDMSDYNQDDDMSNMSSLHDTILLGVLVTLAVVVVALILAVLLDTILAMVKGRREKEGEEEKKEEGGEEYTPATCAPPCSHWPSCVTPCNTTEFSVGNNYGDVLEKHHDLPTQAGLTGCHTRWK